MRCNIHFICKSPNLLLSANFALQVVASFFSVVRAWKKTKVFTDLSINLWHQDQNEKNGEEKLERFEVHSRIVYTERTSEQ